MQKRSEIMHNSESREYFPRRVDVLLFNRFSNHCLANAVEPMRAANTLSGREAYRWAFLTLDGRPVTSSSGLPVAASATLNAGSGGDVLFVLPSYDFRGYATPATDRALRAAARRYRTLVGMDSGSWLLASAGLMSGRRATIHWEELEDFAETFPDVTALRKRVIRDGDIWSCAGAMTAFDLVLDMIRDDLGSITALEVAAFLMHGSASAEAPMPEAGPTPGDALVTAAISVMRDNLEEALPLPALARRLGIPLSRLKARFQADLGQSPGTVYRRMRLNAARRYVEQSSLSVAEIAIRCGYADPAAMTRAFRQAFGAPPRELRAIRDARRGQEVAPRQVPGVESANLARQGGA